MSQKKPYKKTDLFIGAGLLLVVLITAACLLFAQKDGLEAVVTIEDQEVLVLSLDANQPRRQISLEPYEINVTLELAEGNIRFAQSDCPDHICVNTGFISREYQSAVCMPNRAAVSVRKSS